MNKFWLDQTFRVRIPITVGLALIIFVLTFYISAPERTNVGRKPSQPINFSHKLHAGKMQIDCKYCHVGVDKGRLATVPSVNICMNCHSQARADKPEIKKLKAYFDSGKPVIWNKVYRVPDYVYFDHSVHIAKGFDCTQCHGDVKSMDTVYQAKRTTMGRCISCHRGGHDPQPGITQKDLGPTNCSTCHR